jgi:GntR family transcriptional regulator
MSGDLAPGAQLPSTQQLMAQYGVTSQTVQRTLGVLKEERFLIGRAGVGVYVRDEAPLTITPAAYMPSPGQDESYPWMTEAAKRAQRGTIKLLKVAEVDPPAAVAQVFDLGENEQVSLRHQLLMLDGEPTELASIYHPLSIARGTPLTERRKIQGGSPRLLSDLGFPPRVWTDQLSARLPTTEELETLDLPDDVPILRTFRVVYTDQARSIEVQILIKGGHLYELAYHRTID